MTTASLIWIYVFIIGTFALLLFNKTNKLIRCMFFSFTSGLGSLIFLWALGHLIEIDMNITPLSTAISAILGIPGVILMLLIKLI